LAPLLIVAVAIAGVVLGPDAAEQELASLLDGVIGADSAAVLIGLVEQSRRSGTGPAATVLGIAVVLYGGSRVFFRIQMAFNMIWEVAPPEGINVWRAVREQLVSLVMVLGIAIVWLVSVLAGAVLSIVARRIEGLLAAQQEALSSSVAPLEETLHESVAPLEETLSSSVAAPLEETLANSVAPLEEPLVTLLDAARLTAILDSVRDLQVFELRLSFVLSILVFALAFKYVPNTRIEWRDVWGGALVTAVLFGIGRLALGIYLSIATVTTAYGAAGSLVVVLLWINYSAQILFFGAEFTKMYARRFGSHAAEALEEGAAAG
jgi:membrane protein